MRARTMTRHTSLLVVGLLALGACGGGGKSSTKAAGVTSTTTATADTGAPPTTAGGATSPAAAASGPTGAPGPAAAPTTKPAAGGPAASPAAPAPANGTPPSGSATPPAYTGKPQTPPGRYHYASSGTSNVGSPPSGSDLVVDPPQGTTQHARMSSQTSSASSTTDSTYDYQADGVHLVDLTTTTQTSFGPTTLRFHPTPPPLTALARPSPGATIGPFDMTSDDGKTIATVKITVESTNDTMKSGDGADHQTARMQLDTTLRCASGQSCPFTGTLNSTNWLGYDGLTIKSHSVTDGHFGNIAVKSDVTSVVDRATPA